MIQGRKAWLWMLPGTVGLALVMAALTIWAPGAGSTVYATADETSTAVAGATATAAATTPTATATPNQNCVLDVTKDDGVTSVAEDGTITYTITIDNIGDIGSGECSDLTVTDVIPTDTDCTDATVGSSSDISSSHFDISGCDTSGTVEWYTATNLGTGEQVVLTMVVDLTSGASEGDYISNEACADASNASSNDCDTVRTKVGAPVTATPTTAPTATTAPTVAAPTARPTVIVPVATATPSGAARPLALPPTGAGSDGGSGSPLALVFGLAGVCLLGVSGFAFARRPR